MKKPLSLLDSYIKMVEAQSGIHISIHDLTGILEKAPQLKVSSHNLIHDTLMCDCAKTTPKGLRMCFRCKRMAIDKAVQLGRSFAGKCYLGINETVTPVYYNGVPVCVVFAGNYLLEEDGVSFYERIPKVSAITGVSVDLIRKTAATVPVVAAEKLQDIVQLSIYISELIQLACQQYGKISKTPSTRALDVKTRHWLINLSLNYITTYYDKDLSLLEIAKLYHVSPEYFSRLFKRETGSTFTNYLNWVRIDNAKKMLLRTEDSVINISYKIGFNNVTYFNRVFKKYTGFTPTEFRINLEHE